MNATVQCLKSVPELRDSLKSYDGIVQLSGLTAPAQAITGALRDLYSLMERGGATSVPPLLLLQVLHQVFPRFAEKTSEGIYAHLLSFGRILLIQQYFFFFFIIFIKSRKKVFKVRFIDLTIFIFVSEWFGKES